MEPIFPQRSRPFSNASSSSTIRKRAPRRLAQGNTAPQGANAPAGRVECLNEDDVEALLSGALPPAKLARVEGHLDRCAPCQLVVSAAVRTASLRSRGFSAPRAGLRACEIGAVLGQRYRIVEFLARGGMGEVYAAHDLVLGEDVALKILMYRKDDAASAMARLRAEVQLARRVTSRHVCRIFDLGVHKLDTGAELLFLTMQLLRGETLRRRLKKRGRFPPDEARRLALQMATGLAAAHETGVIHRDFKSDNVMLVPSDDGEMAVVMDFGLAQAITGSLEHDPGNECLVAGTFGYMAPEQLRGDHVTAAADIYAFGVVLHEMLTGVLPPFRPRRLVEVPRTNESTEMPSLVQLAPPFNDLVARCLAPDPKDRFANLAEVRRALERNLPVHRRGRVALLALGMCIGAGAVAFTQLRETAPARLGAETASPAVPAAPPPPAPVTPAVDAPASEVPSPEARKDHQRREQPATRARHGR